MALDMNNFTSNQNECGRNAVIALGYIPIFKLSVPYKPFDYGMIIIIAHAFIMPDFPE